MSADERDDASGSQRPGLVLIGLVLLCVGGLAMGVQWLRERRLTLAAHPQVEGRILLAGLDATLELRRDGRGVPHVSARSESDLWFGFGFVHGQDRLAQMLWLRRLARGRTAEWVGPTGLAADRFARTLGFGVIADAQLTALPDSTRATLAAYAAGVTARIDRVRRGADGLPTGLRELGVSGGALEPWTAADSLAVFKLLSWGTGPSIESGPVLDRLTQRLGGVGARPFEPKGGALQTVSIPFEPLSRAAPLRASDDPPSGQRADRAVPSLHGGTAWVLSPRHTAGGKPILAADLHLAPTAPALVHQVHLEAPGIDWAGAAIPGVPVLWAGRNARLAWAVLPARAVNSSYFAETIRPREPLPVYHDGFRWKPVEQREERIRVREPGGSLRDEVWTVQSTRHGPLIEGLVGGGDTHLALGWTGALPGDGLTTLIDVPRAADAGALRKALEPHHEPVVAVVFADVLGQGGYQVAGWLPRRLLPTSLQPVPGRLRSYDLGSRIAYEALPAGTLDASSDWIGISDAGFTSPKGEGGDAEWLWRSGARAARLERLLGIYVARGEVDLRDAAAVQADVSSPVGPALVRALVAVLGEPETLAPEEREMLAILDEWDGELAPEHAAAAVHAVLVEELTRGLFADSMGEHLFDRYRALPQADLPAVTRSILRVAARSESADGWSERPRVRAAARLALRRTWARLAHELGPNRERWSWGRLQQLSFAPFVPGSIEAVPAPRPIGGGPGTLASADHDPQFRVTSASTYRMAVDLAVEDEMVAALAPGQAEEPSHPHFRDGLQSWLEGRPDVLRTSPQLIESSAERTLVLDPGP